MNESTAEMLHTKLTHFSNSQQPGGILENSSFSYIFIR